MSDAKVADEIERLHQENETVRARLGKWYALFFQQQNDTLAKAKERDEALAEIERLHEQINASAIYHEGHEAQMADKDAEIERLKIALRELAGHADSIASKLKRARLPDDLLQLAWSVAYPYKATVITTKRPKDVLIEILAAVERSRDPEC